MAKLLHIFYHKEGTFSLLCQQVLYICKITKGSASNESPSAYVNAHNKRRTRYSSGSALFLLTWTSLSVNILMHFSQIVNYTVLHRIHFVLIIPHDFPALQYPRLS